MDVRESTPAEEARNQAPPAGTEDRVGARVWLATAVVLVAAFMELMDVTMANVAVPAILTDLGASYAQAQWVVAGYALAFAVGLVTGGRLGDIYGRKRMFLAGLVGFMATSLLCGLAPNPTVLIGARVLQGLAAAAMLPQVLASISVWFPARQRAVAFGLFGAVVGLGGIAAPLIGGSLINADIFGLGWRPIFLINIPIGVAALLGAVVVVDESRPPAAQRLDPLGVLASAVAVFLLVFPVIQGQGAGWAPWIWVTLALSLPALVALVVVERWKTRRDNSPAVDLSLFRVRGFAAGLLVSAMFFAGVTAIAFVMMVFLQSGLHYSALGAGACLVPLATGVVVGSGLSIALSKSIGRTVLQLGSLTSVAGALWLQMVVGDAGQSLDAWSIAAPLGLLGVGVGVVVAPLSDFVLSGVPLPSTGSASGLQSTMIQLGSAVGVAVLGAIFFRHVDEGLGFQISLRRVLFLDAAIFAITGLLVFLMPRRNRIPGGEPPA